MFLCFPHSGNSVCSPAQVRCRPRNLWLSALSTTVPLMVRGSEEGFLHEVYAELSNFVYMEEQVIFLSIDHGVIDQLPVPCLIPTLDKAQDCRVICITDLLYSMERFAFAIKMLSYLNFTTWKYVFATLDYCVLSLLQNCRRLVCTQPFFRALVHRWFQNMFVKVIIFCSSTLNWHRLSACFLYNNV